jgi:uncharacterized protein YbjT (DUF2867 family)
VRVIVFGATGMVGQGVLRACLLDAGIDRVLVIGRRGTGQQHAKLVEVVLEDVFAVPALGQQLEGYDACFYCLGVSAVGMKEEAYRRVTYELTMTVARALVARNPQMTFIYISGQSTDSTAGGSVMWARVKGATENAVRALPFKATYMFRPGYIQPMHGIKSSTSWYRLMYNVLGPLYPLLRRLFPRNVTNTDAVGEAMIAAARHGASKQVLENRDINELADATMHWPDRRI